MLWTLGMGILVWCVVALALGSFVGHVIKLGMDDDAPENVAVDISNGAIVLNTSGGWFDGSSEGQPHLRNA